MNNLSKLSAQADELCKRLSASKGGRKQGSENAVELNDILASAKILRDSLNLLSSIDNTSSLSSAGVGHEDRDSYEKRASNEYLKLFFDAFSSGLSPKGIPSSGNAERMKLLMDVLTETGGTPAGAEGGFLSPVDFDNIILTKMVAYTDFGLYSNVVEVNSFKGFRTAELLGPALTLAELAENTEAGEVENPNFKRVEFQLKGLGGILPVASNIFDDTPINIMEYLAGWFGKKAALTNTLYIKALFDALTPTAVNDWKQLPGAIKTALNKTLNPLISRESVIFCNQTGYDLLDQLTDTSGRPLLQPDPSVSTPYTFERRQVVVTGDDVWENTEDGGNDYTRIVISNAREYVATFRRFPYEVASTTESKSAWRNRNAEVRMIMRADYQEVDTAAAVALNVKLP